MTDPQTPATEAGRRLLADEFPSAATSFPFIKDHYERIQALILAIEAEARASLDVERLVLALDVAEEHIIEHSLADRISSLSSETLAPIIARAYAEAAR